MRFPSYLAPLLTGSYVRGIKKPTWEMGRNTFKATEHFMRGSLLGGGDIMEPVSRSVIPMVFNYGDFAIYNINRFVYFSLYMS